MRIKATTVLAVLFMAICGAQAHATKFPPGPDGPGGACEDTLIISDVQNSATCRPATGCAGFGAGGSVGCDSVYGVRGIITGIKNNGSSRTFYMQNRRTNLSYTGMDVFNGTGGLTNATIQIGDSVSVSGKAEEGFKQAGPAGGYTESGETEITGFDAVNATSTYADLPVNILATGQSLPAFHTTSIAEILFPAAGAASPTTGSPPNASAASGEPWESALVRLIGPLEVVKTIYFGAVIDPPASGQLCTTCPSLNGIETRSPNGGGFLAKRLGNVAGDSLVYIDMSSFVTMQPPAVGTKVDSVRGILQGGGSRAGYTNISSWRLAIRSSAPSYGNLASDDLYLATAPEVADAYAVANDSVKVQFDRDVVEASVTIPGHYNLVESGRGVDYVRMAGDNAVVCHISGAYTIGAHDSVTSVSQQGKVNLLIQGTIKGKGFTNGIVTIPQIQAADPDWLGVCEDRSNYAGQDGPGSLGPRTTFIGVATGKFSFDTYVQDEAGGARSGIRCFHLDPSLVGHKYLIAGEVNEFNGETEVNNPIIIKDFGVGTTPAAIVNTLQIFDDFTCDAGSSITNGEDYEGCLVDFSHILTAGADASSSPPGGFYHATNSSTPGDPTDIEIDGLNTTLDVEPNDLMDVKGILSFRVAQAVVFPRNDADMVKVGVSGVDPNTPIEFAYTLGPNPGTKTEVKFALPKRANIDLAVYDLLGRRLVTLARGSFDAGRYSRTWDGQTERGAKVGVGVYFYRLKVDNQTHNLRGVRIN